MKKHKSSGLLVLLLIIAATSAWLSGCGQKGPLYLPSELYQDRD